MNTRPAIEPPTSPAALSVSFNQDASCFSVGLDTGFCIFYCDPCVLRLSRDFNAGIGAVQMSGKTNYIALLGGGRKPKFGQNKVIIWDDTQQKVVMKIPVPTKVRGTRISRTHVVVTLQNSVHVYRFQSPPEIWHVFETADNPLGLCCLTPKILAFPGRTSGQVQLVDLLTGNVSIIPGHGSSLRALDISRDGEVLATASETGTLIRVFATSNCARIAELRRGVDQATIFSLAISPSSQLLAVTSDKSTLHIFNIPHPNKQARLGTLNRRVSSAGGSSAGSGTSSSDPDFSQKWGILGRIPLLPRVFSDVYSFASAHFEMGDEPPPGGASSLKFDPSLRTPKGIIGWTSDQSLVVVGAGKDSRWEKFIITEGEDGRKYCIRDGWKKYLGSG